MSAWGIAPGNRLALDKALKARVSSAQSSNEPAPKMNGAFSAISFFVSTNPGASAPGFELTLRLWRETYARNVLTRPSITPPLRTWQASVVYQRRGPVQ